MALIADLHIHGKYSQATSKQLDFANLEKYAILKGVNLLGTGDFTHPKWIQEIKTNLHDDGSGILKSDTGFPFVLQTEISLVYTQGGKGRRVHHVVLAPNLDAVEHITEYLLTKGRVDYDGRPIFKITSPDFVESLLKIDKNIEVIPAHIWTPWFGMLGSKSGFDSVKECFLDMTKNIHCLETGLSSDPEMNWRLSSLDDYNLVSFSDLHSFWPWRLGREATILDLKELTYDAVLKQLRQKGGVRKTIEVDPNYGKYHADGHRACCVNMNPKESKKHNGICPVCKKPMTMGVWGRVEELADREEGYKPKGAPEFSKIIPLSELISTILGKAVATQTVWKEFNIITKGVSEYEVLLNMPAEELANRTNPKIVQAIMLNRRGMIKFKPGYDGEYGVPLLGQELKEEKQVIHEEPEKEIGEQKGLDDFM